MFFITGIKKKLRKTQSKQISSKVWWLDENHPRCVPPIETHNINPDLFETDLAQTAGLEKQDIQEDSPKHVAFVSNFLEPSVFCTCFDYKPFMDIAVPTEGRVYNG